MTAPGRSDSWHPTRAFGRAILLIGLCLVMALVTGRPDLVVLAAPMAIGTALAMWRRPQARPHVTLRVENSIAAEGGEIVAEVSVTNPDPVAYDLVVARVNADGWLRLHGATRPLTATVPPAESVAIRLAGRALRWGRQRIGPVWVHAVAADGLLISSRVEVGTADVRVYPGRDPFRADDAMPRAAGMVGAHRSRRPGEGGDLAGVRLFAPGDRLRRIDWRVSLRTRQLHVVSTLSDRDAEIVLLIDVLHDAGRSTGIDGGASAMDVAVRAAAGIADHYLHRGDRLSLLEYGFRIRALGASSGHRHYLATLEWLLDMQPAPPGAVASPLILSGHYVPPSALLIVLTPLVDLRSAAMLAQFARRGRFVIAVDTLPAALLDAIEGRGDRSLLPWLHRGDFSGSAARLWRMERANTVEQLQEHGVPVVSWSSEGGLDDVLRQVARAASAPKVGA